MKFQVKNYMTLLPHTVGENTDLKKAKMMMEQFACHHLPVLNGGELVGLLSSHDLSLSLLSSKAETALVKDVMSLSPFVVKPEESVKVVAEQMLKQKINSAIVAAGPQAPWGIFTSTDSLKALAQLL